MKKWEKRLLAIVTVLAMLAVSCFASAIEPAAVAAPAQDVCQGNREGTVNGLPACVNEAGDLHVCADNFPDDNFRAYLLESLAAIYEGLGLPYFPIRIILRPISCPRSPVWSRLTGTSPPLKGWNTFSVFTACFATETGLPSWI